MGQNTFRNIRCLASGCCDVVGLHGQRGLCSKHYYRWVRGDKSLPAAASKAAIREPDIQISRDSITEYDWGWIVGILEGEGSFQWNKSLRIILGMSDIDIIERFRKLVFLLTKKSYAITTSYPELYVEDGYERKPQYKTGAYGAAARALMKEILKDMGERRQGQIQQVLAIDSGWYSQ